MALKINAFNTQELFLSSISGFILLLYLIATYLILSHFNDILEVSLLLIMNPELRNSKSWLVLWITEF